MVPVSRANRFDRRLQAWWIRTAVGSDPRSGLDWLSRFLKA